MPIGGVGRGCGVVGRPGCGVDGRPGCGVDGRACAVPLWGVGGRVTGWCGVIVRGIAGALPRSVPRASGPLGGRATGGWAPVVVRVEPSARIAGIEPLLPTPPRSAPPSCFISWS